MINKGLNYPLCLNLKGIAFVMGLVLSCLSAQAQTKPIKAAKPGGDTQKQASPLIPGGNAKSPVSVNADHLDYFDKEQKAIYRGNVVAVQGDGKLTCSALTIFLVKQEAAAPAAGAAPAPSAAAATPSSGGAAPASAPSAGGSSQVKRMECAGPVTMVSKTQVATGDRGVYEKAEDKVWLYGHVTLSDGGNVTKGDTMIYDLQSGHATVETGATSPRVSGLFISGSDGGTELGNDGKQKGESAAPSSTPVAPSAPPAKTKSLAPAQSSDPNAPFNLRP